MIVYETIFKYLFLVKYYFYLNKYYNCQVIKYVKNILNNKISTCISTVYMVTNNIN